MFIFSCTKIANIFAYLKCIVSSSIGYGGMSAFPYSGLNLGFSWNLTLTLGFSWNLVWFWVSGLNRFWVVYQDLKRCLFTLVYLAWVKIWVIIVLTNEKRKIVLLLVPIKNNIYYYSFKIFPRFWLAESTRIIHHNQFLMTKFGRILCLTRKWRQKCSVFAG